MKKKILIFLMLSWGIFFSGEKVEAENLDLSVNLSQETYHLDATLPINITIKNHGQENIHIGSKIVLEISSQLINFNTLYLDSSFSSLFKVNPIQNQNKIEIIAQKEIGRANINFTLFGRIKSLGGLYDISSYYQNTDKDMTVIIPNIKKIEVINDDVKFGLLNLYWGYEPTNTGTFLGKDPTAEDNVTGIFSDTTNEISNQMNINRGHTDILKNDEHYIGELEFKSYTASVVHFEEENLEVMDLDTHKVLSHSLYTVKIENESASAIKITVEFLSPQKSNNQIERSHAYNIKYLFTVDNLKDIYESIGQVKIKNQETITKETNIFYLHSKLASANKNDIYPIIIAENKEFDMGQLTKTNLLKLLMENVSALDPGEGDLSRKVKVDYHNLLQVANTPGSYPNIVKYTVENSQGLATEKNISVTIKKIFGTVEIDYLDQDGKKIKNSDIIKGVVGTPYQIDTLKIKDWKLSTPLTNSKGIFSKSKQHIKFVYTKENYVSVKSKNKNLKPKNRLIKIYYTDENGHDLSEPKIIKGTEGTSYHIDPLKIEGWEVKSIPKNYSGVFSSKNEDIIFVYKKIGLGTVVIRYFDEEGNKVKNDEKLKGQIGKPYDFTAKKEIKNMDVVEIKGNTKGNYQKETIFITFYYKKSTGTVVIRFVDENGKEIAPPKYLQGDIGEKYSYIPKRTIFN